MHNRENKQTNTTKQKPTHPDAYTHMPNVAGTPQKSTSTPSNLDDMPERLPPWAGDPETTLSSRAGRD